MRYKISIIVVFIIVLLLGIYFIIYYSNNDNTPASIKALNPDKYGDDMILFRDIALIQDEISTTWIRDLEIPVSESPILTQMTLKKYKFKELTSPEIEIIGPDGASLTTIDTSSEHWLLLLKEKLKL